MSLCGTQHVVCGVLWCGVVWKKLHAFLSSTSHTNAHFAQWAIQRVLSWRRSCRLSRPQDVRTCVHGAAHACVVVTCAVCAAVSTYQVKMLFKRFQKLDKNTTGTITCACLGLFLTFVFNDTIFFTTRVEDMMTIPELCINPIANRLIHVFSASCASLHPPTHQPTVALHHRTNELNFRQFVEALSIFLPASSQWRNTSMDQFERDKQRLREKKLKCMRFPVHLYPYLSFLWNQSCSRSTTSRTTA